MKWGPFWCPLPDSFENYLASIMIDTLCLKWWMGSIWKRTTWNLKNDTSAGGQTFFFKKRKADTSLKYSMEDCSIIFLSQKKSVAVLYQYALWGRKPIFKLEWILFPSLKKYIQGALGVTIYWAPIIVTVAGEIQEQWGPWTAEGWWGILSESSLGRERMAQTHTLVLVLVSPFFCELQM